MRDARRRRTGAGGGAKLAGIVYDVEPTLSLSREVTAGTALNALAHCCEALYVRGRDTAADELASAGAREILDSLPRVLDDPRDREARTVLLRGAAHGGEALARSGLALGHALAQVIGGRYGISHGALNALCLPPALRFNAEFVPPVLGPDPAAVAESLARRAGFTSLRELGVPEGDLPELAAAIEGAPGARANPRPASAAEILALLHEMH